LKTLVFVEIGMLDIHGLPNVKWCGISHFFCK